MAAISYVQPSGDQSIDGLLYSTRWAGRSVTFSFPTNAGVYGADYRGTALQPLLAPFEVFLIEPFWLRRLRLQSLQLGMMSGEFGTMLSRGEFHGA